MERGLTQKEAEERKRYLPREPAKSSGKAAPIEDLWLEEAEDSFDQIKEDPARKWQFDREKTRKKRDRRRNLGRMEEDED